MKLTRDTLKKIIKEELQQIMTEQESYKIGSIDSVTFSTLVDGLKAKNPAAARLVQWAGSAETIYVTRIKPGTSPSRFLEGTTFWNSNPIELVKTLKSSEDIEQMKMKHGVNIGIPDIKSALATRPEDQRDVNKAIDFAENNMDFLFVIQDKMKELKGMEQYKQGQQAQKSVTAAPAQQGQQPRPPAAPVQERKKR